MKSILECVNQVIEDLTNLTNYNAKRTPSKTPNILVKKPMPRTNTPFGSQVKKEQEIVKSANIKNISNPTSKMSNPLLRPLFGTK